MAFQRRRAPAWEAGPRAFAIAAAVLGLVGGSPPSEAGCVHSCRDRVAACVRSECTSLDRTAERRCVETCRGHEGCPTRIRTLAYVVTHCRVGADGLLVGDQELDVRHRDCDPVTVERFPTDHPL